MRVLTVVCLLACVCLVAEDVKQVKPGFYIARQFGVSEIGTPNGKWEPVYITNDGNVHEFIPDYPEVYHPGKLRNYQRLNDRPLVLSRAPLPYEIMPDTDGIYEAHVRVELPAGCRKLSAELVLVVGDDVYRVGGRQIDPINVIGWGSSADEMYEVK